jgi:hypothetical protein
MDDGERGQYHQQAEILLGKRPWTPGDVDQAVMLHDLLETPGGGPDPLAKKLRARLSGELEQRLAHAENPVDRVRLGFFSAFMLDTPDPLARRLFALFYRGMTG